MEDRNVAQASDTKHPPLTTRWERFWASYVWLVLKNLIGWPLILASFVAGPLVPGPGGIPLFLIGFALISFPGKRKLTARVLRGKEVRFRPARFALISFAVVLPAAIMVLLFGTSYPHWVASVRTDAFARGPADVARLYLVLAAVLWVLVRIIPHVLNLLIRLSAAARRRFRPWLRDHHIRLLPPRWRRRHPHEDGSGSFRLKDEILKFTRHHQRTERTRS